MGGVVKSVGNAIGGAATTLAKGAGFIPGIGTLASAGLNLGGNLLQGHSLGDSIGSTIGGLLPAGLASIMGHPQGNIGGAQQPLGGGMTIQSLLGNVFGGTGNGANPQMGSSGSGSSDPLTAFLQAQGIYDQPGSATASQGQGGVGGFLQSILSGMQPGQAQTQQQSSGGILDFLKNNAGLLGGIAGVAGGSGLFGSGVKGAVQSVTGPQALNDPRTSNTNDFAAMMDAALKNGGNIGSLLQQVGQGQAYQGQLSAGQNDGQNIALGDANSALAKFMQSGAGAGADANINRFATGGQNLTLPPELQALLGGSQVQQNSLTSQIQSMISGAQNPAIQNLLGQDTSNPIIQQLLARSGYQSGAAGQLQDFAGNASNGYLSQLAQSGAGGNSAISALQNFGAGSPEQTMLQQLAASGSNPYINQLASIGQGGNAQAQMLQRLAMQSGGGGQQGTSGLSNLINSSQATSLLNGGQGSDLNTIAQALAAAQQPQQDRNLRDLREQFSYNGLRNSTDLNAAAAQLMAENQSNLGGQLAQIAPQLAAQQNQTSLGALQAMIGGAGQLGSLGQGNLSQQIQALLGSGNLSQQQGQLQATAASGAAGAQNQQLGTLGQILGQAGQLGQGVQGLNLQALTSGGQLQNSTTALNQSGLQGAASGQNQLLDMIRQSLQGSGSLANDANAQGNQAVGQAGSLTGQSQQNFQAGQQAAGSLQNQSLSQMLQALTTMQGNTGSQSNNQLSILANLFGGQQGQALQAALAQPSAMSQLAQLPGQMAGQNYNLNSLAQTNQQDALTRQYQAWIQQQSLTPQLLQFLQSSGPQQYGPSMLNTGLNAGLTGSVIKQSK